MKWFNKFKKTKVPKIYTYCLHNLDRYHSISDSLLQGFIDVMKHDTFYQRNSPIFIDCDTLSYFVEGWELDYRLIETKHIEDKGYRGLAYRYKDQIHPLINSDFELNNFEGIIPFDDCLLSYNSTRGK